MLWWCFSTGLKCTRVHIRTHTQTIKQTNEQTSKHTNTQASQPTHWPTNQPTNQPTNKQTNKKAIKQASTHARTSTPTPTPRHPHTHTHPLHFFTRDVSWQHCQSNNSFPKSCRTPCSHMLSGRRLSPRWSQVNGARFCQNHGPGRIATTTTCCSLATVSICSSWLRPVYSKDCVFASLMSQGGRIDWTLVWLQWRDWPHWRGGFAALGSLTSHHRFTVKGATEVDSLCRITLLSGDFICSTSAAHKRTCSLWDRYF